MHCTCLEKILSALSTLSPDLGICECFGSTVEEITPEVQKPYQAQIKRLGSNVLGMPVELLSQSLRRF